MWREQRIGMEKQISFSIKTVRFSVLSFTALFSLVFLVFLCSWVFKSSPSSRLGVHNLDYATSSSLTAQSLRRSSNSSSEYLLQSSVLKKTHFRRDDVYSQVADVSSIVESNSKVGVLTGNSSLKPFIKNVAVDSVNTSYSDDSKLCRVNSNSTANEELGVDTVNAVKISSSKGEMDLVSDVSFKVQHNPSNHIEEKDRSVCDITKGKWVYDENYPLYTKDTCPFIDEGFNCEGNGRLDKGYMKWRWQPQGCDIPRFNATNMLEMLRGKRLVFVGDSLNRNQWESMLCLLISAVKDPKKVYETRGRAITKERGNYCFKFEDYKCTVEYYVSHFLSRESKAKVGKKRVQTLHIDAIDKGSSRWRGADILVFNTAHWWSHSKTKAGINYYQEGDTVHPQLDVRTAYRRSLTTWASWIDSNINPRKTRVFFRSSAPSHFSGGQWNSGGHCGEAREPINEASFVPEYPEKNLIVEEILSSMKKNRVTLLNITGLSSYRADAHPSIYGRKSATGAQDCSHWCLPGVPDTWNQLLYYYYYFSYQLATAKGHL